jgi:hypothetical protein
VACRVTLIVCDNIAAESAWRARIDHENSVLALIQEKLEFIFSVWNIELRLSLDKFAPCTINPQPLLANVDELTAKAREITRRLEFRLS